MSSELSSNETEEVTSGSEYDPNEDGTNKGRRHVTNIENILQRMNKTVSSESSEDAGDLVSSQNADETAVPVQGNAENVPSTSKGKKRLRSSKTWSRNVKKARNLAKTDYREIGNCRCKCDIKLSILERQSIYEKYCSLSTHAEQTIYLQGCIKQVAKSRTRQRNVNGPRKRTTFLYEVNTDNGKTVLCQKAFLAVHGIFKSRLEKKVKTRAHPTDKRGRHATRPNRTPTETLNLVRQFIANLPARESHYTRSDSRNRKYLDPNLSITKIHDNFNVEHPNNKVSYGIFSKVFNEEYNISFGYPRKDICNTCTKFLVDIRQAEMEGNDQALVKLKRDRELHLRRAEAFKTKLANAQKSSDPSEMVICFDYEKNLPLPVTNAQDEYYVSQLWLHVFGIHNLSTHKATMYIYTENFALKGPNEVITCLSDYIENHKDPQQHKLNIFCDNAFSQNKNRILFTFLDQLCKNKTFNYIEISYPIPGHSMMPIDRDFAAIEKKKLKLEKVDNPETYVELIKSCRKKNPFNVVFVQHSLRTNGELLTGDRIVKVKNFKLWVEPYVKSSVPGISKTRFVAFEAGRPIVSRQTMTGDCSGMSLYKVGMNRKITSAPKLAYGDSYLKIKPKKLQHVIKLLKLVTSGDIEFYKRTLTNAVNIVKPTRNDTGNEEENNIESDTDIYE